MEKHQLTAMCDTDQVLHGVPGVFLGQGRGHVFTVEEAYGGTLPGLGPGSCSTMYSTAD